MNEELRARFIFLDNDKCLLKKGKIGIIAMEFSNPKEAYLDVHIKGTPYYSTGHIGFIANDGQFFVYTEGAELKRYLGKAPSNEELRKLNKYLIHQFDSKKIIRRQHYFLVDDKIFGFKHIYPYPGKRFLSEYYKKFISSPQLRNFFFEYHAHVLKKAIGKDSGRGLKVLDVAAGDGSFLAMLKKDGFEVYGFEPSVSECQEAKKKGIKLINSTYDLSLLSKRNVFDFIIAGNIFEHIPNPYDFMRSVKLVLRKGGCMFFQIPNDFNILQNSYLKRSGMPPWFICPPEHLNYWNVDEARYFVKRCGFEIIHEEAQFPIEMFLLFGMDYRKHPELGKEAHRMRCNFEDAFAEDMDSLSSVYSTFIKAGIGRDYVAILKLLS